MYKKELKYIIEVNKGIYLTRGFGGQCNFTDDIEQSTKIEDLELAKSLRRKCGGKILYYTITHEVK